MSAVDMSHVCRLSQSYRPGDLSWSFVIFHFKSYRESSRSKRWTSPVSTRRSMGYYNAAKPSPPCSTLMSSLARSQSAPGRGSVLEREMQTNRIVLNRGRICVTHRMGSLPTRMLNQTITRGLLGITRGLLGIGPWVLWWRGGMWREGIPCYFRLGIGMYCGTIIEGWNHWLIFYKESLWASLTTLNCLVYCSDSLARPPWLRGEQYKKFVKSRYEKCELLKVQVGCFYCLFVNHNTKKLFIT